MTEIAKGFDYDGLDKETRGKLVALAGQVRRSTKGHIEHALQMGEAVHEAHGLLSKAGCESKFGQWVEQECGFGKQTAYNYLNAFLRFGGQSSKLGQFTSEAIYLLSCDGVPDSVVKATLALADKQRVTMDVAQATLDRFRTISAKGKPGGVRASSSSAPASSGPAAGEAADSSGEDASTEASGTKSQEHDPRPPRNGKARPGDSRKPEAQDYGKCPNCASTKWTADEFGASCAKCHHPHGEPLGDSDETGEASKTERAKVMRLKLIKTVEACQRAVDDMNDLVKRPVEHKQGEELTKQLLRLAKGWPT